MGQFNQGDARQRRRVIGEMAGPVEDEIMENPYHPETNIRGKTMDEGWQGGAVAVQDGHVVGGNMGQRMPDSGRRAPAHARAVYYDPADQQAGMSIEGRARSMAVPTTFYGGRRPIMEETRQSVTVQPEFANLANFKKPASDVMAEDVTDPGQQRREAMRYSAEPMRRFLDTDGSLVRAEQLTSAMRPPMTPGRRAIMDDRQNRSNYMADSEMARQLEILRNTPESFGNGAGVVGKDYFEPTPQPVPEEILKLGIGEKAISGRSGRLIAEGNPQNDLWGSGSDGTVFNKRTGDVSRPMQEDSWSWSPTGQALVERRTGAVITVAELQKKAEESGLKNGQHVSLGGLDFWWSDRYGTFLDETGKPVYEPPEDQRAKTYNDLFLAELAEKKGLPGFDTSPRREPPRKPLGGVSKPDQQSASRRILD